MTKIASRCSLVTVLVAVAVPCSLTWAVGVNVETFDGNGPFSDTGANVTGFDLPDWTAPLGGTSFGGSGAFDGDSYNLSTHEVGQFCCSIAAVGDIYQAIGQINRNLGPASNFTGHARYENFEQGSLLQVQSIDTFFNFGNELGNNDTLFELIGTTYESFTGNMNSIVFIDAATTLASVTPVNVIPGGGNFNSLDVWVDVSADTVNGGTNVVMNVSVDDGPLQEILNFDGTTVNIDFTQAMNVNAALGYVSQETVAVGAPDPMRTGATLDFAHFQTIPEPASILLCTLAAIGCLSVRRSRG